MFKPEITSHEEFGPYALSIFIKGHGLYDVRADTLELVTEHLANTSVRDLRKLMTAAYWANEGVNPELAGVRRAELLFIAAEYPTLYVPGMAQLLGLTCDEEGRYWVPPTDEDDQNAEAEALVAETNAMVDDITERHPEVAAPAVPAFVADPTKPTDAELVAAIQRGLATGQIVDATDWLAAQRHQDAVEVAATIRKSVNYPAYADQFDAHTDGMAELISKLTGKPYHEIRAAIVAAEQADTRTTLEASAAQHGHATTCTAHGGRDLAACDPADCDEAALAASFTVTVRDDEPGDDGDWMNDFSNEFRAQHAQIDSMITELDALPDLSDGIDPRTYREVYDAGLLTDDDIRQAYSTRLA